MKSFILGAAVLACATAAGAQEVEAAVVLLLVEEGPGAPEGEVVADVNPGGQRLDQRVGVYVFLL